MVNEGLTQPYHVLHFHEYSLKFIPQISRGIGAQAIETISFRIGGKKARELHLRFAG